MIEIALGKDFFTKVDDEDVPSLMFYNWGLKKDKRTNYAQTKINGKQVT